MVNAPVADEKKMQVEGGREEKAEEPLVKMAVPSAATKPQSTGVRPAGWTYGGQCQCCPGVDTCDVVEGSLCLTLIVFLVALTYPIYVMVDRTTPILKSDEGLISTATYGIIFATFYSMLTLVSLFRDFILFPKVPAAAAMVALLFYATCDVWNAIRFQKRQSDNEDKFGDEDEPNSRAEWVAAVIFFDFLIALALFVVAVLKSPWKKKNKKSTAAASPIIMTPPV
ncbi:hypothetical protein CTAYLR_005838 [Chrysophaeum taylorii]|uniref:MARVEL domain-containing protein n=1 Tax=Chrysophaeum taylorii TaxID=2483200 RepID=A0AAD7XQK2_9STRA|nr:hypothetical protein CTAYLR_005838 [Chrysophaeum taylorii]